MRNIPRGLLRFPWLRSLLFLPIFLPGSLRPLNFPAGSEKDSGFVVLFTSDSPPGASCYRIPALALAPNGDLLAVADERHGSCNDLRGNRNINIVLRRSTDNGKTWEPREKIIDFPDGQSASDPSLIMNRFTSRLFLFFNFMDLDRSPEQYQLFVCKSNDNGKTWDKPVDITTDITGKGWRHDFMFITSGGGCQEKGGWLLNTLVNLQRGVFVIVSKDHGNHWQLMDTPVSPADESKITVLRDGRWIINSRVNSSGVRYVHVSADSGKSWITRADSSLPDPGCNAGFISGQLWGKEALFFCNPCDRNERRNLALRSSFDAGIHWSAPKTIWSGPAAYSSMIQLSDGSLGILFEKDDYASIVFTKLLQEDIPIIPVNK